MNLANILKESAERHPDRTALVFYDRRITYSELFDSAFRFASALGETGIEPGDRVALVMPNVPEFAIAFYGALAAGAEVVPVNPMYTAREIGYMFKDAEVKLAVAHPLFEGSAGTAARENAVRLIYSESMGDPAKYDIKAAIKETSAVKEPIRKDPRDTALIVYTNNRLGYPIGACLTHSGLKFNAEKCRIVADIVEQDSFITVLPLYHAFSFTACLNLPIMQGSMCVMHEMFNESRVVGDLEKEKISIFPAVPTILKKILDTYGDKGKDFSSVRAFISGGAPPMPSLLENFRQAFNANVYEGYGITECGPVTSVNPIKKRENKPGSVGPPLEDVSVKVVGENEEELPEGEVGRLIVKGENVMEKYLNRPDETARFLKDGWFHTPDLARLDEDGFIHITGRLNGMIVVGGFNVYPEEVELEVGKHPAVESCRVFGVGNENLGERVAAEIILRPDMETSKAELQKFARKSLAPYKIPRKVEFIHDPAEPPQGKKC